MKLNTKVSLYFVFAATILTLIFFATTDVAIKRSFNRYRIENEDFEIDNMVHKIEVIYESKGRVDEDDFSELNHILIRGGYGITIHDKDANTLWKLGEDISSSSKGLFEKIHSLKVDGENVGFIKVIRYKVPPLSDIDKRYENRLYRGLITASLLGGTLAVIIGMMLAKEISRPIVKIKNAADILSNGELSNRVHIKTDTQELEDLNSSINYLASSLEKQEMLRRRLTSDISHELRTPLNVLQNQLEALIDGIWEATPDRLNTCYLEVYRLTNLVKKIEKLVTLDDSEDELVKESISLKVLLKGLIEQFEAVFMEKEIEVKLLEVEDAIVAADPNKLKQVFINLLSNASKYTNRGGEIRISIEKKQRTAIVEISDTGVGIPKDDLPHVFQRFYRADNSRSRKTGGVGLGLAISKGIIDAHDGAIHVQSRVGEGTTFTIELPL